MGDFVTLQRLDPAYRACFADGSELLVRSDRDAMAEEIRSVCGPEAVTEYERYCGWLERLFRLEMRSFLARNYDGPLDLVRPLAPALQLLALGGVGRLDRRVRRAFTDERLQRLFSFQALYAGVAPQQALAMLAVISYMDVVAGVWFPTGGIHAVATGLAAAADKGGVRLHLGVPAQRVILAGGDRGPVRGVVTADGYFPADVVVCNGDLPGAYSLVPGLPLPRRLRDPHLSPSALVWHAGVRGRPGEAVAHHNIHFGSQWQGSFRALIDQGRRMPDPSLLVSVPTLSDPSLAPHGSSVLYALEPVPNLRSGIDWERERDAAEATFRRRLDALGYPVDDVAVSRLVDPVDWSRAGHVGGTPFSLSHRFLAVGAVPTVQRREAGPRPAVHGMRHRPRNRRAHGAPVGPAGRRPRRPGDGPMIDTAVPTELHAAYARCRQLTRAHGTTYFWATQLLPARCRPHVYALYGFCRHADDIVDSLDGSDLEGRAEALALLGDQLRRALRGEAVDRTADPVVAAVAHTAGAYGIDPTCFERFLRSMTTDLDSRPLRDVGRLARLHGRVGGGDRRDDAAHPRARRPRRLRTGPGSGPGVPAHQLPPRRRRGPRPRSRLTSRRRISVVSTPTPGPAGSTTRGAMLMAFEIQRARQLYEVADDGIALLPAWSARSITTARILYARILDEIYANDHDVFHRRARVSTTRKILVTARVALTPAPSWSHSPEAAPR